MSWRDFSRLGCSGLHTHGGTILASRLLTDELWNEIKDFFPTRPVSPLGGRPSADNRTVLTSILFVLKTGIAWEDLPLELGCSYKTCGRRLREWTRAGVWQQIFAHLLTELRVSGRLEMADVLIDAGLVKAPLGGTHPNRETGRAPIRRIAGAMAASIT